MEGEFQDQGQLDQDFLQWLYPIGGQPGRGFFSGEEQEYIQIEGLDLEVAIISNQAP